MSITGAIFIADNQMVMLIRILGMYIAIILELIGDSPSNSCITLRE